MKPFNFVILFLLYPLLCHTQENHNWKVSHPILTPGISNSFDEISVKDPSLVYFENKWHLFFTARSADEYTTGYVSSEHLKDLNTANRHELKMIRGKTRYGCAPQIFYFEPQNLWYLVYQNRDSNYQPVFSTNANISNPETWSSYKNLIEKDSKKKWIDFWVIADKKRVYLFYTEGHNGVMVRSTSYEQFPGGWGKSKKVFEHIHEAVHIYKVKGKKEFHLIYELNKNGIRSFGQAKSKHLEGPWIKASDEYATGNQLEFEEAKWTEMISHGEVLRSGYNQLLEYDPENCTWLIQGILKKELNKPYERLPWKLGIITKIK